MDNQDAQESVINYGQGLIKILQGFKSVEPHAGWFERILIKLLRATYQQRLRAIVAEFPPDIVNKVFAGMETSGTTGNETREMN